MRARQSENVMQVSSESRLGRKVLWALAVGATVGLAAGIVIATRSGFWRRLRGEVDREAAEMEERIVELLSEDEVLSHRAVEVSSLAPGIIELVGTVNSDAEAHRAVAAAQKVEGVRTVLNRLDVQMSGRITPKRTADSGVARGGTHWYGMGVGMGRRRQGVDTDPKQRDDSQDMISRDLSVGRADIVDGPDTDTASVERREPV
jgi:gas vesicle protein